MLNIVLFDKEAIIRIARRIMIYFSNCYNLRTTEDAIWLNGLYFKFYPHFLTINPYNSVNFPKEKIADCLSYILQGEEIFISDIKQDSQYISIVDAFTCFDTFLPK